MALEMVLRRMNIKAATVRGFRSAFRDWCGEETHFPREIAEAALAALFGCAVGKNTVSRAKQAKGSSRRSLLK
ncbi:MAG: hypothetical protein ACRETD_11455 [Steroidobacteraceae bacterium]